MVVTTKHISKRKITSKTKNLEHKCILQESCCDVGKDIFYVSGEITVLEIAHSSKILFILPEADLQHFVH